LKDGGMTFPQEMLRWSTLAGVLLLIACSSVPPLGDYVRLASALVAAGRIERDVTYGIADGVALKLDLYYPKSVASAVPIAVYVHGGGWTAGDKSGGAGLRDLQELVSRGYLVAAINYRLAPRYKFPAQIEDVKCAIRYLRANAVRHGADPERIGAWGGSAGGHLVALLGVTDSGAGFDGSGGYLDQSSRVQAVVDMFGPTDLTKLFAGVNPRLIETVFGTTDRNAELLKKASPVNYVSIDDPPFLILHGELDKLVPPSQSQVFYEKLKETGVPATLVIVKNAGHGFSEAASPIWPSREEISKMVADFFDRHLKQPSRTEILTVSQTAVLFRSYAYGAGSGLLIVVVVSLAAITAGAYLLRKQKDSSPLVRGREGTLS